MKKFTSTIILTVIISFSNCIFANAATPYPLPITTTTPSNSISIMAEQTEWITRIYNGKLQKRLWSITYAKWLTDWIDVE